MKKLYLGCGLLLAMLALGVTFSILMPRLHDPVAQDLKAAAEQALLEDWEAADAAFLRAKDQWEKYKDLTAMVCDHKPQEEMQALFAQVEVYCRTRDSQFAAACRQLAEMAEGMSDLHSISLPHLF